MLKSCLGKIEVEGKKPIIQAELSTLLQTLRDDKILTDEEIDECIKNSRMTEEEMKKLRDDMISKLSENLSLEGLFLAAMLSEL